MGAERVARAGDSILFVEDEISFPTNLLLLTRFVQQELLDK
jgi:hypothetical protein